MCWYVFFQDVSVFSLPENSLTQALIYDTVLITLFPLPFSVFEKRLKISLPQGRQLSTGEILAPSSLV